MLCLSVSSSCSIVGRLDFSLWGKAAVNRYFETPMGLRVLRKAYSTVTLLRALQSRKSKT